MRPSCLVPTEETQIRGLEVWESQALEKTAAPPSWRTALAEPQASVLGLGVVNIALQDAVGAVPRCGMQAKATASNASFWVQASVAGALRLRRGSTHGR